MVLGTVAYPLGQRRGCMNLGLSSSDVAYMYSKKGYMFNALHENPSMEEKSLRVQSHFLSSPCPDVSEQKRYNTEWPKIKGSEWVFFGVEFCRTNP